MTFTRLFLAAALGAADPGLPPTVMEGAKLEAIHDESQTLKRFFEGPSYDPRTDTLYFTAFEKGNSQLLKLDGQGKVSVFLDRTEGLNGTFLSRRGDLLGCQGERSRVVRIPLRPEGPGALEAIAEGFEGKPLGKPNDLAEDARGGIYFTDPDFKEMKSSAVYYIAPGGPEGGKVEKVITDMQACNGIYVGKGGHVLYVADSGTKHIRSYPLNRVTGAVDQKKGKVFFDPATENQSSPDGMTMDVHGNMYFTGRGGVWAVDDSGRALGLIPVPEFCSNVTFGGKDGRTLYLTCQSRVYRLSMKVAGWEFASRHEVERDAPLRFREVVLDKAFRSEGAAIADVNRDGRNDVLVGDLWYEAPSFAPREIREPGSYDIKSYSRSFGCFAEDWTGDGYPDLAVIPFPGEKAFWYENPRGKPERWKEHDLWHSACNETPLYTELLGNGKRQLVMAWQPPGKDNEGIMGYLTPPASGQGTWEAHPIGGPRAPATFRFSHGLGVGDVNGDGRNDVLITEGWWEQPREGGDKGEWPFHRAPFGQPAADLYAHDLNGDGLNDIISSSAHSYGVWWHEQFRAAEGKTGWRTHLIDDSYSQTHALHLLDMNGDGVKDLLTGKRYFAHQGGDPGEFEPVVSCWYEVKKGNPPRFIPHLFHLGVGIGTQFPVGDLNGDKLLDIAVSNKKGVHILEQAAGTAD